jgi:hypothetical protein
MTWAVEDRAKLLFRSKVEPKSLGNFVDPLQITVAINFEE